ncbi:MAG: serine hydrolase domain-containing protein [Clostridia bacterium]
MKLNDERVESFEKFLFEMMDKHNIPGISLAIAHKEKILYSKGFGYRDMENKREMSADTILGIASISKSFAALAIAQLVMQGKMSFEDPLTKYYKNFKLPDGYNPSKIKVKHLLNHTAGFPPLESLGYSIVKNTVPDEGEDRSKFTEDYTIDTIAQLAEFMSLAKYEMLGKPGEILSYSNDSYGLLGGIVEKVSGLSYQKYIKENVFQPLKMNRSFFDGDKLSQFDNVTTLYYEKDDQIIPSRNWQEAPPYLACGWIRSSVNDLIKYAQMYANGGQLFGERIISKELIQEMILGEAKYTSYSNYGFGLSVTEDYQGLSLVEHGGSLKGVSSHFGFIPEANLSVVVLCNLSGVAVSNIWLAAVNTALSLPLDLKRREYNEHDWSKEQLSPFEGEYVSLEGAKVEISIDQENICAKMNGKKYDIKMVDSLLGVINVNDRVREISFLKRKGTPWAIGYGGRVILKKE